MALKDCINRAGDALSVSDRKILETALSDGMSDIEALGALQAAVESDLSDIADRVRAEGGEVATQLPPMAQGGVNVEVAPDPDNKTLTLQFNNLTEDQKFKLTFKVAKEIFPKVFQELGITDSQIEYTTGGFMNEVNPSLVITVPGKTLEELDEIGKVLGYVASQQAVVTYDEDATDGDTTNFVKLIPDQPLTIAEQGKLYRYLHAEIEGLNGYTYRDDAMVIGDFEGVGETFASLIETALAEYPLTLELKEAAFQSNYIETTLEGTSYASSETQQARPEKGQAISGRFGSGDISRLETFKSEINAIIKAKTRSYQVLKQSLTPYGFFSALENAVDTMNLPAWKKSEVTGFAVQMSREGQYEGFYETLREAQEAVIGNPEWIRAGWKAVKVMGTAPARGIDIWQKIQATGGLKKDETEWTGIEEFLTSDPDAKFTRQQIKSYIASNGVQYDETVADVSEEDARDQNEGSVIFGEGEVDDNSANWEGRVDDMLYEFNAGDEVYWFSEEDQRTYIEENLQNELISKYIESAGLEGREADAMQATMENMDETERLEFAEKELTIPNDMLDELESAATDLAEQTAETEYLENPYMSWSWSASDGQNGVDVFGNDDVGYRLINWSGRDIATDIYSFSEVEIQANQYAMENGWLYDEDEIGEDVTQWERYGIKGDYTNYREVKMKLPSIPGEFFDPHFKKSTDENLLAFLRVTDRDMMLPLDVDPDPRVLADYEAELAKIPKLEDIDITKDKPPDELWMEQPQQNISMFYGDWKGRDDPLKEQLVKNWENADQEKRTMWITTGIKAQRKILSGQFNLGNNMTKEELADGDDPGNASIRSNLEENYSDEGMEKSKEKTRRVLEAEINEQLADGTITSDQGTNLLKNMEDSNNWNQIASGINFNTFNNNYQQDNVDKNKLNRQIEDNNSRYNSIEQKRERAGKGRTATLFLDEVQSGWHGSQGGGRELGYITGRDAGEIDQEEQKLRLEIGEELRGLWTKSVNILIRLNNELTETQFVNQAWKYLLNSPNKDIPLVAKLVKLGTLIKQARTEREGVPNVPFKGDAWLSLGLKRSIIMAIEQGYDAIAWPNNTTIKVRWSEKYDYGPQYDQKMPSIVKKLTKIQPVMVDEDGVPIVRTVEPKVDTSGWTVEADTATTSVQRIMEEYLGADLQLNLSNIWIVKIPELDFDEKVVFNDDIISQKDALKKVVVLYEKQIRMLEFYDIDVYPNGDGMLSAVDQNGEWVKGKLGEAILARSKNVMARELADDFYKEHYPREPEGSWIIPVTDELRESVEKNGFPFFQEDRGRFYPGEFDNIIQLTKTSDLSTFLHESGHLFLETQKVWAKKYGLDDNQKAMLEWLGVGSFDDLTVENHEQWAESFEVYLRTGKAPSLKLRQAFAAFSRWLKKIYRMLTDSRLRRADDGSEIAAIFDRMLATEEEIAEAAGNPEYDKYFKSKEQAGMNESQWKAYQKRATRLRNNAEMTVDEKIMAQYMNQKTKEWDAEKAPLIEEERERLAKLPIYQILADVQGDKKNNVPGMPFNTDALKLIYPDGIPKKLQFRQSKEGIDPAQYAEAYGYPSAKAMLDEIIQSPSLKVAAQDAAQARMIDKYGDILADGTLEAEVREALVNEDQAELLLMELQASKKTGGINREYLKAQAVTMIAAMKYNEIKPGRFYSTMVRAAQDAVRMEDPTDAKIQQLANHYLYREAVRVREQMLKHRRYVKSVKNRKFDTNKLDSQYAQKMKMLAEMYEMRQSPEQLAELDDILNFFSAQVVKEKGDDQTDLTMLDPNLIRAIEYRTENGGNIEGFELIQFEDMTAEDLNGVVDMLRHLSFVGRQIARVNSDEVIKERMEVIKSIRDNGGKDHPIQRGKVAVLKEARKTWYEIVNSMPSLVNMTRKLDGMKAGGQAFKKIFTRLSDANDRKLALNTKYYSQFEEMVGSISRVNLSRMDSKNYMLESGEQISLSSEEVFMMALYWGTESSREAIRQGHQVTDNDVKSILSNMSKDQLNLVNTIWRMNETHWPDLQRAAIAMEGYAPPKLAHAPFTINGVEMEGGHMQLMYDSQRLDLKNEQQLGTRKGSVMPTKAGTLNARVGSGGQPVNLDVSNITRSIDDKVQYIAFAEAARDIRRLVNNPEVRDMIEQKHGSGFYEAYIGAIEAVTTNRAAQESSKWIGKISRWSRQSLTMMQLMYSIRNTAQQFSALPIAMAEVGPQRFVWASTKLLSDRQNMVKFIREKSKFMDNRAELVNRDSREAMRKVIATSKVGAKYQNLKAHGFMFQIFVDSTIAYPTWLAAYQRGMDTHGIEKQAQIEADSAVGESVGSGSDLQLGRIMQSNQGEITKTITIFGSWFNAYYQRLYRSSKGGEDFVNLNFAMDAVLLPFIAANIAQALILDMPDTGGEEDETWLQWAIKNQWIFIIGTLPLVREFASLNQGFTPSAPINALPKSLYRIITEFDAFFDDRQTGLKTGVDIGRAVSSVAKLPGSGQLLRILEYIDSYLQGEEGDFNPLQMLVEGADKDG